MITRDTSGRIFIDRIDNALGNVRPSVRQFVSTGSKVLSVLPVRRFCLFVCNQCGMCR